ncbi:MAG: aspartate aminotransferase [Phycisphaerae bacterium]|nr:aspartate aminotransferase [Phycisphaerae bacterium]|tara:strand:+ start:82 stop:1236 length:1155 start_codon:yes stop_codon:yes gene_type:complete
MLDEGQLLSHRTGQIDASGIRRAFQLGAQLENPINLSIGQPHFPVPDPLKTAAIEAIQSDSNGYTLTGGHPPLRSSIESMLQEDIGWDFTSDDVDFMVTSGTSGALVLAAWAMLDPGDEFIIPDPFFVIYPALGPMTGATPVYCDLYPDFRMTADRVEPLLTPKTKIVMVNSPANPTGIVLTDEEMRDLAELCRSRGVLLLSDEIYDLFTYSAARDARDRAPSPALHGQDMLIVRGFGKNYGCTGWRLGFAAGPTWLIQQMIKFQQYSFVCAPSMAQHAVMAAHQVDMSPWVEAYEHKRDLVLKHLAPVTNVAAPEGAFYAFPEVPASLGMTGTQFTESLLDHNVIAIPGGVFSNRDSHMRISYATEDEALEAGLKAIAQAMKG